LGLFLAVLIDRSLYITYIEVIFWFWSTGFMLDEIVGFNEQGFSLYIMSIWNAFDLGILLLLVVYYCMRLYGIIIADDSKGLIADNAYDVLAANAVLLFPRLFSILDHYRYFSQLLVAFRLMATDLVAVLVLILISCSGFFVTFTLSFGKEYDASSVAYSLFQMVMGFTPAAWDAWPKYNLLGKAILTLFLFMCHFLIVTILITVLTNSFMAIVANANEEHQFLFAVNTISMVKSDALFSYVAPTNILMWVLTPLRYFVPFRLFVKINRTVIKVTHLPVLFLIYIYERLILQSAVFDTADLVGNRGRPRRRLVAFTNGDGSKRSLFSPAPQLRQGSVATYQKDRALDEVFRRPFRGSVLRNTQKGMDRRQTTKVVKNWISGIDDQPSSLVEQDRSLVDRLEARTRPISRAGFLRWKLGNGGRDITSVTRSVASDPEEFMSTGHAQNRSVPHSQEDAAQMSLEDGAENIDADDELVTDEDDTHSLDKGVHHSSPDSDSDKENRPDFFYTPSTAKAKTPLLSSSDTPSYLHLDHSTANTTAATATMASPPFPPSSPPEPHRRDHHARNPSNTTILFNPISSPRESSASPPFLKPRPSTARQTPSAPESRTPARRRSPRRPAPATATKPRPILPPRAAFQQTTDVRGFAAFGRRRPSSLALDLGSDGDLMDAGVGMLGAVPASFTTQMAIATGVMGKRRGDEEGEASRMMSRLVLARMKTLEESFREVVREVREMRREGEDGRSWSGESTKGRRIEKGRERKEKYKERKEKERPKSQDGTVYTKRPTEFQDSSMQEHGSSI
jgi:hypothetical protein